MDNSAALNRLSASAMLSIQHVTNAHTVESSQCCVPGPFTSSIPVKGPVDESRSLPPMCLSFRLCLCILDCCSFIVCAK